MALFQLGEDTRKQIAVAVLLCLGCTFTAFAEEIGNDRTTTIFLARTGSRLDSPHSGTYHYLELLQIRGKWIFPDAGTSILLTMTTESCSLRPVAPSTTVVEQH